jgi:hypothetical protein
VPWDLPSAVNGIARWQIPIQVTVFLTFGGMPYERRRGGKCEKAMVEHGLGDRGIFLVVLNSETLTQYLLYKF